MKTEKIVPMFQRWAETKNKKVFAVPINEKRHVEIAFNDAGMDVFAIENKKVIGMTGFRTPNKIEYGVNVGEIFAKLSQFGADITKVAEAYRDTVLNFVKK